MDSCNIIFGKLVELIKKSKDLKLPESELETIGSILKLIVMFCDPILLKDTLLSFILEKINNKNDNKTKYFGLKLMEIFTPL